MNHKSKPCFHSFLVLLVLSQFIVTAQQVKDVPQAFLALHTEPEVLQLDNELDIPMENGHFQGIQVCKMDGKEKIFISGSSHSTAYLVQGDLASGKTEKLIRLMKDPFRHAGGFQMSEPFLAIGIEDNYTKTTSKVNLYNYQNGDLLKAEPVLTRERSGAEKTKTSGATGLLKREKDYLLLVTNWDSRNYDFYSIDIENEKHTLIESLPASDELAGYQSVNLIQDKNAVYALGFYSFKNSCRADLIRVSSLGEFKPKLEKINTKTFTCKNGGDFNGAAGLQIDEKGILHVWSSSKYGAKQIRLNRFSPK